MGRVEALEAALTAAKAYVEHLERQNVRLNRMLSERSVGRRAWERDLATERAAREQAQAAVAELTSLVEQEQAARGSLETQVADLEVEKRALERALDKAVARESETDDETTGWDDDATRRRVLRVQATRARLAKTDMSPWARLRTLRQADGYGIDLTRGQRDELDELEEEYGDVE